MVRMSKITKMDRDMIGMVKIALMARDVVAMSKCVRVESLWAWEACHLLPP